MPSTSTLIVKQSLGPSATLLDRGILRITSHSKIPNKFSFAETFINELVPTIFRTFWYNLLSPMVVI